MKKVLIVEDEAIAAIALQKALERAGLQVTARVSRGEDVEAAFLAGKPDLILMDIRLAGPMTGIEAVEKLRSLTNAPVVFMSGYDFGPLHERALATEPLAFIPKPIDIDALIEIVGAVPG